MTPLTKFWATISQEIEPEISCGLLEKVACQFLSIDKPLFRQSQDILSDVLSFWKEGLKPIFPICNNSSKGPPNRPSGRRRFCAVQAFSPQAKTLAQGEFISPEHVKSPPVSIKITTPDGVVIFMEAPPRLELGVKVLQTSALPLGYGAGKWRPTVSWSR